uniref:Uncharacterized protein n=1 Tax=Zea mays TaxID=4577 RepID=C4J2V7_MAIZE|nr:unknown [Zea mays]
MSSIYLPAEIPS